MPELLLLVIVICLIVFVYIKNNSIVSQVQPNIQSHTQHTQHTQSHTQPHYIPPPPMQPHYLPPPPINPVAISRDYDYRTLNDPLVPPYKRDEWNLLIPGIYTRGPPMPFHKYGTLTNDSLPTTDKYKFLFLMGRQKYPGSNSYDYYATGTSDNNNVKFDLPNNTRELYDGDKVKIKHLNDAEYKIIIDRNLELDYNPFYY